MSKSSSKNLIRIIAVVVIALAMAWVAFSLIPKLFKLEGATESVVMLRQSVPYGTRIDEEMLTTTEIGSYGLGTGIIKDKAQIIGKYAAVPISSKDILYVEKFMDAPPTGTEDEEDIDLDISNSQMLLTLELSSTAAGAAGKIGPGDRVNTAVYTLSNNNGYTTEQGGYYDENGMFHEQDAVIFPPQLQNMMVYRVQTAQLTPVKPDATVSSQSQNGRIPAYITLVVTQEQADLLLQYSYGNIVHFLETDTVA